MRVVLEALPEFAVKAANFVSFGVVGVGRGGFLPLGAAREVEFL